MRAVYDLSRVVRLTQAKENYEDQYRTIKQDIQRQHRTVNSDVLQEKNTLFEAQRNYYNAIYDYILDRLRLKRTVGTLNVSDLESFNQWLTLTENTAPATP